MSFPEEKKHIEVGGGDDWAKLKLAGVLETLGLGPCVGVGVYSKVPKIGFLGHFIVGNTEQLNTMLQDAEKEIRYPATAQLWVGGGSIAPLEDSELSNEMILEYRATIEQALEDTFGPLEGRIKRDWLNENSCIDCSLNVRTGEIHTEITPVIPDDNDPPPEHRTLY